MMPTKYCSSHKFNGVLTVLVLILACVPRQAISQTEAEVISGKQVVVAEVSSFKRPSKYSSRISRLVSPSSLAKLTSLGRLLFYDTRLSRNGMYSCATCHNPSFFWTDSLKVSVERSTRRSMSLLNVGFDKYFTWQGRAGSIVGMIRQPLSAPRTMDMTEQLLSERLQPILAYQKMFDEAYEGRERPVKINFITVGFALEAYISSIISPISSFDRYVDGDISVYSKEQRDGFDLFRGKAGCAECHSGWRLSDSEVYDIGLKLSADDPDLVRGTTKFKAVGLRSIASRPPYMHDGSFDDLSQVIDFYDRGGDAARELLSSKIRKLELSDQEKSDLLAFLNSLIEEPIEVTYPILPRS